MSSDAVSQSAAGELSSQAPPFFSVVVPAYNAQEYLVPAIESVLAQSNPDWELIIVDDFSSDQTPHILQSRYSKNDRIRVITNSHNVKVARSLNRGIHKAKGQWIVRLDADDAFTPGYLAALRHYINRSSWDVFFAAWITVVDETGKKILNFKLPKSEVVKRMMKIENFIFHPATCFSKKLWTKVGGYPEEESSVSEDTGMWIRFFEARAGLVVIPEYLVHYRIHYTNMTSIKDAHLQLELLGAKKRRILRQNKEWRASLFLKQLMLRSARAELSELMRSQHWTNLKNLQYYLLTFMPKFIVWSYMWKIRPYARHFFKKLTSGMSGKGPV